MVKYVIFNFLHHSERMDYSQLTKMSEEMQLKYADAIKMCVGYAQRVAVYLQETRPYWNKAVSTLKNSVVCKCILHYLLVNERLILNVMCTAC